MPVLRYIKKKKKLISYFKISKISSASVNNPGVCLILVPTAKWYLFIQVPDGGIYLQIRCRVIVTILSIYALLLIGWN